MYNHGVITVCLIAFLRLRADVETVIPEHIQQDLVMTKVFKKLLKMGALMKGKRSIQKMGAMKHTLTKIKNGFTPPGLNTEFHACLAVLLSYK